MSDTSYTIYLLVYILTMVYFVILGCWMLFQRDNLMNTHSELVAKRRMTRTMGVAMFLWASEMFIYLPPAFAGYETNDPVYKVIFLVLLMLNTALVYNVMFAVVQRTADTLIWSCSLGAPFLLLAVWQVIAPPEGDILIYIGAALSVASLVCLLVRFASEYRIYMRRVQSEYSETSSRDIAWSWICFSGLAVQGILFVVYELLWSPTLEVLYGVFSIASATYLCFCISKQRVLDLDVVDDGEEESDVAAPDKDKLFYTTIEERLETCCEDKLLFLEPTLTREVLCRHLSISSTYLKMYFNSRGLTFYQYINTLRAEYAYRLMQENPDMPICDVCERSGFRSQTTFCKVFQEVLGCLPSEVKRKK